MSIVTETSAISILCDCPYTGKIVEVKESPERDQKRKIKLLESLKETKKELVIAKHVLVDTRHKLAVLQRILSLELGYVVNPYLMAEPTWKNIERKIILDSEAMKFKKLWENSRLQKRALLDSAHALKKELENVNGRIIRAEDVCSHNIITSRVLADKLKGGAVLSKLQPKGKEVFGEYSLIHYRSRKSQIEVAINENKYLKHFLKEAILSKTEDLKQYRQSLLSTAERYRNILRSIRNEIIEKEQKEKKAVEEKKTAKKKKK